MAQSDKFTPRTKHIALKYHHFRRYVKRGEISILYCPTDEQKADILTKPLTEVMFQRMIEMCLGSKDSQIAERGHQVEGFLCTGYDSYLVYIY